MSVVKVETHWDYLLKEMGWLAADFQKERARHVARAKKVIKSVEIFHKSKDVRAMKRVKDEALQVRKISSKISKDVRKFWMKIDKIIAFKQKGDFDEIRQKAMDKHLVFLVKQTERYTYMIAENMKSGGQIGQKLTSSSGISHKRPPITDDVVTMEIDHKPAVKRVRFEAAVKSEDSGTTFEERDPDTSPTHERRDYENDDETDESDEYIGEDEPDDETTMIEEEGNPPIMSHEEEMSLLQKDSEMTVEQLKAMYANIPDDADFSNDEQDEDIDSESVEITEKQNGASADSADSASGDESDEYIGEDEPDDETTMIEEEGNPPIMSHEEEMSLLQKDSEMTIEQLKAMYANIPDDADFSNDEQDDDIDYASVEITEKQNGATADSADSASGDESDEYIGEDEPDDETTMIEEESNAPVMSYEEEMSLLQKDSEMTVEQLKAMYADIPDYDADEDDADHAGSNDGSDSNDESEGEDDSDSSVGGLNVVSARSASDAGDTFGDALRRLELADDAARSVYVERPFVLAPKLSLREYQHCGLNWLVSLHERRLNGILADEMGLGKTVQTIALLAYLAAYRGIWGPHLVVVPTSCLINWEMEFKKFCPIFKILTYYGSAKTRKNLRTGWSKLNSFHICITSYQLVVQDSKAFRKKRWYYMILDEAHNIKNFKSQRWQTLLNFNTQRRLLLTGTPLQNNLMELWSLMHFLMPYIFRSRKEFSYWFNNPLNSMVDGSRSINNSLISRLHSIMRPFVLRRLKVDVAKQLPPKYEHIVMCKLSKRQLFLYEEYMSRSSTRNFLQGGNYMGMMNILMQLRKVCNHPDLFEPRPIISPFLPENIYYRPGNIVLSALEFDKLQNISSNYIHLWQFECDLDSRCEMQSLIPAENAFIDPDCDLLYVPKSLADVKFSQHIARVQTDFETQYVARQRSCYELSKWRCSKPSLSINWRLVQIVTMFTFTELVNKSRHDSKISRNMPICCYDLIKSVTDRVIEMKETIEHFVFVLPKATSYGIQLISSKPNFEDIIARHTRYKDVRTGISHQLAPYYPAKIRQEIFFPDRKLIQFDSGKLQTLCVLLRRLKAEGHKCLIFTQMSKMLDILEAFLNLHAHSYVRLDGSTAIDRRQKLMDRFNNDPKLFCFILSTRSGGLGINLTGANCVIFYDSDWNPAMDAQAQDRAHRIGQTREVNIYRLVCESTVEENILVKAKQKRHLDFLVMTEGSFSEEALFSSDGLKDLLGTGDIEAVAGGSGSAAAAEDHSKLSAAEVEAAMAAAEDAEDLSFLKGVKAEIAQVETDFDESAPLHAGEDEGEDNDDKEASSITGISTSSSGGKKAVSAVVDLASEEKAMEVEFASWQASVGPDFSALEAALKPIERYAMNFHTVIEPYYSMHFLSEQERLATIGGEMAEDSHWDVEEIEREKEEEERRALAEGELLAADLSPDEVQEMQSWYCKERIQRQRSRRNRLITGEGWSLVIDELTRVPYWYNADNGDASYAKPPIVEELENYHIALERKYSACPHSILVKIFEYLLPYPDRMSAGIANARWRAASLDACFHKRVLSVESGARDAAADGAHLRPLDFVSISKALVSALPGDTIILCFGHHWEEDLDIRVPVRLLSEQDDPTKCVVELSGQITLSPSASSVVFCGITFRRPRKIAKRVNLIKSNGCKLLIYACHLNNEGALGSSLFSTESQVSLFASTFKGATLAGIFSIDSNLLCSCITISDNDGHGIFALSGTIYMQESMICRNKKYGICVNIDTLLSLHTCKLKENVTGNCSASADCRIICQEVVDDTPRNTKSRLKSPPPLFPILSAPEVTTSTSSVSSAVIAARIETSMEISQCFAINDADDGSFIVPI